MDSSFKDIFKKFKFLKPSDLFFLYKISTLKYFERDQIIAEKGKLCNEVYFIRKGIIRTYILTSEGKEKTTRLALERDFTSPAASFLQNKPSEEYLFTVEDCKVVAFNIAKLNEEANTNTRITRMLNEFLKEAFMEAVYRIEFFGALSPEERYKQLLTESPKLIKRVPQKYLASFLGVTEVSLSRIRSRIF